jgi:hypothetical protein
MGITLHRYVSLQFDTRPHFVLTECSSGTRTDYRMWGQHVLVQWHETVQIRRNIKIVRKRALFADNSILKAEQCTGG